MNILVIDHSEDNGELIRRAMAKHAQHATVHQVLDTPQAARAIESFRPELVVVDLLLPSGSGLEMIDEVKRTLPGAKVILFTGYDDKRTERWARESGADAFVSKEDGFDKLADTLCQMTAVPQAA